MSKPTIEAVYPLAPMQQGMLFHNLLAPDSGAYFEQFCCTLRGKLDKTAFIRAWQEVIHRQSVLRTAFAWKSLEQMVQIVYPQIDLQIEEQDWQELTHHEQEKYLQAYQQADRVKGFDLAKPPLMRLALMQIGADKHYLLWSIHHILMDGWSMPLILNEVMSFYEAYRQGRVLVLPPGRPYKDYIAWLQKQDQVAAETYWRRKLRGFSSPTPLGVDRLVSEPEFSLTDGGVTSQRVRGMTEQGQVFPSVSESEIKLSREVTATLQAMARRFRVTFSTVIQAAWALLLSRYSGETEVVFGLTVSGRPAELGGVETMIGLFINTLPVRIQVNPRQSLREYLQTIQAETAEMRQFEYSSLAQVQTWSDVPHGIPLFESILVFENYPVDKSLREQVVIRAEVAVSSKPFVAPSSSGVRREMGLRIEDINSFEQTNYPLNLISGLGDQLPLKVSYDRTRFEAGTIQRMLGHLKNLLEEMTGGLAQQDVLDSTRDQSQPIGSLSIFTEAEHQQILSDWSAKPMKGLAEFTVAEGYYQQVRIHDLFEEQVRRDPDATALIFTRLSSPGHGTAVSQGTIQQWSYAELNQYAERIASHLRACGVGAEVLVGLWIDRSPEMIAALLGILKAGGAYLPLDPNYPDARLAYILKDAESNFNFPVIICSVDSNKLQDTNRLIGLGKRVLGLQTDGEIVVLLEGEPGNYDETDAITGAAKPDPLVYVIYTSGSTGTPKGVMVTHPSVVNHALNLRNLFQFRPADRMLQFISLSFDASAEEIFPTMISGAALVLLEAGRETSAGEIILYCDQQHVSLLHMPAPFWHQCIDEMLGEGLRMPKSLRLVLVGGETPAVDKIKTWQELGGNSQVFINAYGPTEATITATAYQMTLGEDKLPEKLPIGRPLVNVQIYILMPSPSRPVQHLELAPVGVTGELYIGGAGVARGYLNQPELTLDNFIDNPFGAGRLYRTGDLARFLPDGNLEFRGRSDEQVKLRGFRIELGEIEYVLRQYPGVNSVVVVVREDIPGDKRLVAYIVPADERTNLEDEAQDLAPIGGLNPVMLREAVSKKLPEYMVPGAYVFLKELPLTSTGKVDRRRLPAPTGERLATASTYRPPHTPTEAILAGIIEQVLGLQRVGVDDNFFELGGHSLLATRVVSRIRNTLKVEIPLRTLFEAPTVAGLSQQVESVIRSSSGTELPPIVSLDRDQVTGLPVQTPPLSFAQQRLWFLDQLSPGNLFYNLPLVVRARGVLDISALEKAVNEIVRRHESLRTNIQTNDGKPVQVIKPHRSIVIPVEDLRNFQTNDLVQSAVDVALTMVQSEVNRPFNLETDPLLRVKIIRIADNDTIILMIMHHIVSDGWSMGVLLREISVLYTAFEGSSQQPAMHKLPELSIQYAEFAQWQRNWLQGEVLDRQLNYWKKQLASHPGMLDLPTDHPRPAVQSWRGATLAFNWPQALSEKFLELCRMEGVTPFMALLAVFQTLLYRYSGQEDISVGTAIANRNLAEIEPLIGFFVNTLVMRVDLSGQPGFRNLLKRVREVAIGAYTHQDLPFEMLVEELQPQRDMSHTPLFQVAFTLQNLSNTELQFRNALSDREEHRMSELLYHQVMPELSFEPIVVDSGTAKFDLTLTMSESPTGFLGALEYNRDLFEPETIQRMLLHFQRLVEAILENPEQPIITLDILTPAERQQILVDWNATAMDTPTDRCAHQLFEAHAAQHPDALAVIFEDQSLTYRELNQRANLLSHYLRKQGIGPDHLVGISTERSLDMVVAILGAMKSGGCYLPLDPTYPVERLSYMMQDSQVTVLLTQKELIEHLPLADSETVVGGDPIFQNQINPDSPLLICLDTDWETIVTEVKADDPAAADKTPPSGVTSDNLAYMIYTSGSTGRPKGTLLNHRGLSNLAEAQRRAFDIHEGSRILQFSPLSFDASVWEIFMALANGGTLCLARQEVLASGQELAWFMRDLGITTVTLPPSVMRVLPEISLPVFNTMVAAGEACTVDLVKRWAPGRKFFNAYGPTETTVCASMYLCDPTDPNPPPIGRPIANTHLYVLDRYEQPVPVGVPGELHVAGVSVARGYWNQHEMTLAKFILNPFEQESGGNRPLINRRGKPFDRLYKTGDLVRYRTDGNIEFLGRVDQQVKVRGFRIELGEVETILLKFPGIKEGVVVAREDTPGDKRLVAYVVPKEEHEAGAPSQKPLVPELREFMRKSLPEYMVPSIFLIMASLPLSPSGKIDRRALPAPDVERPTLASAYIAPRNPIEARLVEICANLLGLDKVGIYDNFFELGGHSLLATQFISRVRDAYQVELPLRELFVSPTPAAIAEKVNLLIEQSAVETQKRAVIEESTEPQNQPEKARLANILQQLSQLSEEQAKALLEAKRKGQA